MTMQYHPSEPDGLDRLDPDGSERTDVALGLIAIFAAMTAVVLFWFLQCDAADLDRLTDFARSSIENGDGS